jgi:Ca-activated chloride channel family protein
MIRSWFRTLPGSKILLGAFIISAGAFIVRSQEPLPALKITAMADLVTIAVSVRDKTGTLIDNLAYKDFIIREDGREEPICYFTRGSGSPLTIGLIIDTMDGEINRMAEEKAASRTFLNRLIRPEDKAFIIQVGDKMELLQDVTSSPEDLAAAIDRLKPRPPAPGMPMPDKKPAPDRSSSVTAGSDPSTLLSDAIRLASGIMSKRVCRHALIVLGDDSYIGKNRETALAAALAAAVPIYPIRIFSNAVTGNSNSGESASEKDFKMFAQKTGGAYFEIGRQGSLEQTFRKIEEELQSQYIIGYLPGINQKSKEGFRAITVTVKKEGLTARTIEGYYFHHESTPNPKSPFIIVSKGH